MKARTIFFALFLALPAPTYLAAQAVTTDIAATEIFDPLGLFGNGSVGSLQDPGELTCPGAEPTGDLSQPCPPGSRIKVRGTEIVSQISANDGNPWLTGWLTVTANSDMDANAAGHAWGTFRIVPADDSGVWEGRWTGKRTWNQDTEQPIWTTSIQAVGQGISGDAEGKQLRFEEVITSFLPISIAYMGTINARLLEPPSSR